MVPGVSGGTVALLLGIYDRLVGEIRQGARALGSLARGRVSSGVGDLRRVDWVFLGSLLGGILLAVVVLVGWLRTQMEDHPVEVSAVFFGLVAGSVIVARREVDRWDLRRLVVMAVTAVVTFCFLGLRSGGITDPTLAVVFGAGALAVCAMILPGISGSFILLMLGLYDAITAAVDERQLSTVGVFALGAVVGLAGFSTLLGWLLDHHRPTVVAVLVGLMIGSLRVLWPWPAGAAGLENADLGLPVAGQVTWAVVGAVTAGTAVVVLARLASGPRAARTR